MNNIVISKQSIIATAVAFVLVFGVVWFVSSLGGGVRDEADASKPTIPDGLGEEPYGAPPPKVAVVKAVAADANITVHPPDSKSLKTACAPRIKNKKTLKDMFPMGSVINSMPEFTHPYRRIAELFPSFEYSGRLWMATGRFVNAAQAELTPTGYQFEDGRKIFALANTSASGVALFVQSADNPFKFAVYRRT